MSSELIHRRRWGILAVLCLSLFLAVVDNTIVNVALPTLSRSLGATTSQLQWIVDAYALVFAALLLVGGSIGDRRGRKGALQVGLVLFTGFSVYAATTTSAPQLIVARGLMGVGAALVFPATLAILTNVFVDPVERAKAIGAWSAVVGLAVALGPISGGILLKHFWWGSIFLVNLPVAVIAFGLGALLVPSSKDPHTPPLDPAGIGLSIVAVGLLVFTTIQAPELGWLSARTIGGFVVSVLLFVSFVLVESRRAHPMLDVSVFRNPRFSAASASITSAFFAFFGFIFLITQYFQFVRGYDTLSAGLHTLPFALAAAITAPLSPRVAFVVGTKRTVSAGLFVMAIGFVISATVGSSSSYWFHIVPSMVMLAIGLQLTTAPSTDAILGSLPLEKAGIGSAINDTTRELGGTMGVAVIGSVFSSVYGPKVVRALSTFPIPKEGLEAARKSMGAAMVVAERAPAPGRGLILSVARQAFMSGMHAACVVAASVAFVGALTAFAFLPSQARRSAQGNLMDAVPVAGA